MKRRRFGSIVTVRKSDGRTWIEARYTPSAELRDQWGRLPQRLAKRFPTGWDIQAEQWLNEEERLIRLGTWTPPSDRRKHAKADTTTFHEYATEWIETRRKPDGTPIRETTKQKYRETFANHLDPVFGAKSVTSIGTRDITKWRDSLTPAKGGYGSTAIRHAVTLLKGILNTAATQPINDRGDTLIDRNPVTIRVGKAPGMHVYMIAEPDEIVRLAEAMPDNLRIAVLLAGWLGLREGEVCGLQRRDIDLVGDEPAIHIRHSVRLETHDGRQTPVLGPPKTESSVRDVMVPTPLVGELERHLRVYVGKGKDDMLFTGPRTHGLLSPQSLRNAWERARTNVPRLKTMRFHDLRHTALTRLAELGATGGELMAQAGHTSLKIASVYQQASDSHRREIMRRLDQAMSGTPEQLSETETPKPLDLVGELRKLAELHAQGVLDDAEFKAAKKRLLEG